MTFAADRAAVRPAPSARRAEPPPRNSTAVVVRQERNPWI